MPQYTFGSGELWGVRTDVANSTPMQFGTLQEASVEFTSNVKELHGQYQFPVAVGRGSGKISGKCKFAQINGKLFADLFFGVTPTVGQLKTASNEAGTIPGTPFAITVANGATWVDDLGVKFAATGLPLTKVASAPTTGQYSVASGGVYTFAAADTTLGVQISYTYTAVTGVKQVVTNQLLGTQPIFTVVLKGTWGSKDVNIKLHACISTKLGLATKLEDFVVPEMDFSAFADASNQLATISTVE